METGMQQSQDNLIRELCMPIYQSKGWLKLIGILSIIYGIILVMTLFGIIIAWLPIWMGVLLLQSASSVERAQITSDKALLLESLDKIKTYFTIMGVLTLIGLAVTIICIILGFFAALVPYMHY